VSVYYFAYGGNMDEDLMIDRGINFQYFANGILENYQFVFNKLLKPGEKRKEIGAAANVELKEAEIVWGVIYELTSEEELKKLDYFEGAGYGRTKRVIIIMDEKRGVGRVSAFLYEAKKDNKIEGFRPSAGYLSRILKGAIKHRLPADYINKVRSLGE
jgi:gamma-glutamylcyclotransferase (GGCT)/AIG2-like uncharacterized protein YtfP